MRVSSRSACSLPVMRTLAYGQSALATHAAACGLRGVQVCMNQCSGRGECRQGFCVCQPGWYGHDCARRKQGLPPAQGE